MLKNLTIREAINIIKCNYGGSQSLPTIRSQQKVCYTWKICEDGNGEKVLIGIRRADNGLLYTSTVNVNTKFVSVWNFVSEVQALELDYPNWDLGTELEYNAERSWIERNYYETGNTRPRGVQASAGSSGAPYSVAAAAVTFNQVSSLGGTALTDSTPSGKLVSAGGAGGVPGMHLPEALRNVNAQRTADMGRELRTKLGLQLVPICFTNARGFQKEAIETFETLLERICAIVIGEKSDSNTNSKPQ